MSGYQKRGNPFKRGKTWTFIYYETQLDGKKLQKSKGGFHTKKATLEAMAIQESYPAIEQDTVVKPKKNTYTLGKYLIDWFENKCVGRLADNTLSGYGVNIRNHIIPAIGHIPLCEVTHKQVQDFYNTLTQKLSPSSIRYIHRTLSKALKDGKLEGIVSENVAEGSIRPKLTRYRSRLLSHEEIAKTRMLLSEDNAEFVILAALALGLRRGEALGLKFEDFDLKYKTVHIVRQISVENGDWKAVKLKTENSDRIVQVPDGLLKILDKFRQRIEAEKNINPNYQYQGYITCDDLGHARTPNWLQKRWKSIRESIGANGVRYHDLRHP